MVSITHHPIGRSDRDALGRLVLGGVDAEMGGLDAQAASFDTITVGPMPAWPRAAPMIRLSGTRRVEAVLDEQVLLDRR